MGPSCSQRPNRRRPPRCTTRLLASTPLACSFPTKSFPPARLLLPRAKSIHSRACFPNLSSSRASFPKLASALAAVLFSPEGCGVMTTAGSARRKGTTASALGVEATATASRQTLGCGLGAAAAAAGRGAARTLGRGVGLPPPSRSRGHGTAAVTNLPATAHHSPMTGLEVASTAH